MTVCMLYVSAHLTSVVVSPMLQRRLVSQNIKRLKDIGCYRGRRHIMVSRGNGVGVLVHKVTVAQD